MPALCADPALIVNRDRAPPPKIFSPFIAKQSSRAKSSGGLYLPPIAQKLPSLIPARPLAAETFERGVYRCERAAALLKPHIQINPKGRAGFLVLDIDRGRDSAPAILDAMLPAPQWIAINPDSGNAHAAWALSTPVSRSLKSRAAPIHRLAQIERALMRRLGADPAYAGLITHNPLHPKWQTVWPSSREGYSFSDFDGWFTAGELSPPRDPAREIGTGRNCALFDDLRAFASGPHGVLRYKRQGASLADFLARLDTVAAGINQAFHAPLPPSELRAITKSIARWTWRRFTPEKFVAIQSHRGKQSAARRWAGHVKAEPWTALGISRATYYRQRQTASVELRRAA